MCGNVVASQGARMCGDFKGHCISCASLSDGVPPLRSKHTPEAFNIGTFLTNAKRDRPNQTVPFGMPIHRRPCVLLPRHGTIENRP